MKKSTLCFLLICIGSGVWSSCSNYLDVKPKDQYLQNKVFSNEAGIHEALTGIYLRMASPSLYGNELSMGIVDVMAQYYNLTDYRFEGADVAHRRAKQAGYIYQDTSVSNPLSRAWQNSYNDILNINTFISQLKGSMGIVSDAQKSLLLGEAYGLRAYLHFDLLRLFGPIYAEDPDAPSIPYLGRATDAVQPILPASIVADSIDRDIAQSLQYLEQDPIRGSHAGGSAESGRVPFFQHRDRRFNYYAAQLLQARVELYARHRKEALKSATDVITESSAVFPWDPDPITPDEIDPLFSDGIIFGLPQPTLRQQYLNLFDASLPFETVLMPDETRLFNLYDRNLSDYYYNSQWAVMPDGSNPHLLFVKYRPPALQQDSKTAVVPLMRLSEAYYIAAECSTGSTEALSWLNEVRRHRGETPLEANADLEEELFKAYLREFWGEGQLFYFFKRTNRPSIPDGNDPNGSINMNKNQYVVPLPLVETQRR